MNDNEYINIYIYKYIFKKYYKINKFNCMNI